MKMAMMILDLQKAYLNADSEKSMKEACAYINAAIPLFRDKGLPVIWIQHKDEADGSVPGKEGFEFIDELKPGAKDHRIVKEYGNAFNKTDCRKILEAAGIDTLLITGFCAEYCVLSTYRGAEDLDLRPILLRNAIASGSRENAQFVESISAIMSFEVLAKLAKDF